MENSETDLYEANEENPSFVISRYMMRELGLSGAELLVYAIIHSFTVGRSQLYFGKIDYMAAITGVAGRTIYRALQKLKARGLVYETEITGRSGLRTREVACTHGGINPEETEEGFGHFVSENMTKCQSITDKMSVSFIDDNKVDNKEITTTSTPTTKDFNEGDNLSARWENGRGTHREGKDELASDTRAVPLPVDDTRRAEEGCLGELWSRPKMSVRIYGADGVVTMTEEQYEALVSLVGEETLGLYIERLEALILKVNGGVYPHSHYRTLREWLTEDFST